ncbi:hypothetical protein LTR70_010235 [Exophiala xenobiotica]|uniref:Azaphilone pigments biosynthesis cluster protein L N-terminal domain-containing protein n=1 Tax=Lithohypha guttulata TaxID=1690604 RepID=A0ABR0JUJ3_9EURO|nr:hypothetical protein LTR24_010243 [Lithohypha guttulata]KAK5309503.1 hypothetical protein LTR70_010235 [Exophiala xenobiotica]
MAEPISLASGLLALATFALQSSVTLYNRILSFKSHHTRVRDLVEVLEELQGLSEVLNPLSETIRATTEIDFSPLDLPLLRCGNACKEFEQELLKCSSRSSNDRTSFRDWARLRYMGDDIDNFRRILAGYKLTITIALADANLRQSSVTVESLRSYEELIETATDDLQARLESIDEKLEVILGQTVAESSPDPTELNLIKEERLSTQKCLQICEQLSEHISQIQLTAKLSASALELGDPRCPAKLERHMKDLIDRLVTTSQTTTTSKDEVTDLARLRDEWETTRQCMDICSKADNHLKENVSVIDNFATGDAVQFMVSTNGKILHGKNRGTGWKTRQVGGYLSDAAVMHLSRDISGISHRNVEKEVVSTRGNGPNAAAENGQAPDFGERWGRGFTLVSRPTWEGTSTSTGPAERE